MTWIPTRDMPVDAVKATDPVTGATYMRLRRRPKTPDTDSQGGPLPATCRTPFCAKAGLPHEKCPGQRPFLPYFSTSARYIPSAESSSSDYPFSPFIPPRPDEPEEVYPGVDRDAFQRWMRSFPHWNIPREMPPDWKAPKDTTSRNITLPARGKYTPYRFGNDLPQWTPAHPTHRTPLWAPQGTPPPMVPPTSPWSTGSRMMMDRIPDLVEWNNVQGGKVQWTPHPWIAHPLPHPGMPAQAFWDAQATSLHPWRGPGGWSPTSALDAERMHMITGGHPLPGMDPYWTPTAWVPPLHPPRTGVYVSPWLSANPRDASAPHILWDAAVEPPYRIRRVTSRGAIVEFASTDFFKEQATYPAVKTLQVNLPNMKSSWGPVVISKSSTITVGDVFRAVWDYLHKPIVQCDWDAMVATYGQQRGDRIKYAFTRRCMTAAGLYEYVRSQGVKRVDFLEGNTVYWGIYPVYNVDGTWALTLAFLPRTRTSY